MATKNNTHVQPNGEQAMLFYPHLKLSPFYDAYKDRLPDTAIWASYNHRYHLRCLTDPIEEYWALTKGVTLWDVHVEAPVRITGRDAFWFANYMTPRDLTKCHVGQAKYVFICDDEGRIINDPVLLRLGENDIMMTGADSDLLLWARGLAAGMKRAGMDIDVQIEEPDISPVQVQGPRSGDVMVKLFGDSIRQFGYYGLTEYRRKSNGELTNTPKTGAKVWRKLRSNDGVDMDVIVSRTGFSGEVGFEIYLANAARDGVRFWNTVWEAGQEFGMVQVGPGHIRRIEAGILSLPLPDGLGLAGGVNPYEVGYGYNDTWAVVLDQEQRFCGQEALQRIHDDGPTRRLAGVEIEGGTVGSFSANDGMTRPWPVYLPGSSEEVGLVTSACWSPRLERNIGFAMVPIEHSNIGQELVVETELGTRNATVVQKPFVDATKDTPKSLI